MFGVCIWFCLAAFPGPHIYTAVVSLSVCPWLAGARDRNVSSEPAPPNAVPDQAQPKPENPLLVTEATLPPSSKARLLKQCGDMLFAMIICEECWQYVTSNIIPMPDYHFFLLCYYYILIIEMAIY